MAQKKAHEVDAWLRRPDPSTPIILLYGPDRGLVSERARSCATTTGLPLDDPFTVIKLDASDIEQQPGRLVDEARTIPMFSERRLIWIRNAGQQKGLADEVKLLLAEPPRDAIVLIEAGELKKGAALRTTVEGCIRRHGASLLRRRGTVDRCPDRSGDEQGGHGDHAGCPAGTQAQSRR
jgi:DNA polymerase-3 subunit delta